MTVAAAVTAAGYKPAAVPNVHVADRTQFVSNPDGLLSSGAVAQLNAELGRVWQNTTAEPVVVALKSLDPEYDEVTFANDLFELWKIGKADKDNGLLLLIVGDTKRYTVRTGRGLGGILPDGLCGSIMREEAVPLYKKGDLDGGTLAAVKTFASVMEDPVVAEEIRSKYANDANAGRDEMDAFTFMAMASAVGGVGSLIWVLWIIVGSRRRPELERYRSLNNAMPVVLFLSFACMGMALPAFLICRWKMKRIRNHARACPNCGYAMRKLDEATDNEYLTPAQDMEERINSVDYDVWLCDNCGEKDVIPFVNRRSAYAVCPHCGARTAYPSGNRILRQPTERAEGQGVRIYSCRNCGKDTFKPYTIAKLASAAPVIFIPGGGGGFGGGGGGFSGGSFGGGGTSGGGASGGW